MNRLWDRISTFILVSGFATALLAAGCSAFIDLDECESNDDCPAVKVCDDGICVLGVTGGADVGSDATEQ